MYNNSYYKSVCLDGIFKICQKKHQTVHTKNQVTKDRYVVEANNSEINFYNALLEEDTFLFKISTRGRIKPTEEVAFFDKVDL